jgi:hypothetical protein
MHYYFGPPMHLLSGVDTRSCRIYHHIVLPARITVGDTLTLRFGSNPKDYDFNVMRIVRDGEQCTIFDNISEPSNQIEIAQCREAAGSP